MSYFDISGAVFNNQLRELETSDPAHADMLNVEASEDERLDAGIIEEVKEEYVSMREP